jgi:hypothetical protein
MALLAVDVPEDAGGGHVGDRLHADLGDALGDLFETLAGRRGGHADAREVALHVGAENRDAGGGELFGHHLQRDGLSRAGCARDKAMAVRPRQQQVLRRLVVRAAAANENAVGHVDLREDDHC